MIGEPRAYDDYGRTRRLMGERLIMLIAGFQFNKGANFKTRL